MSSTDIDARILRQTKVRVARCLFESSTYNQGSQGTYDRFIPSRANNSWETTFANSTDGIKNCQGAKKVRGENGDNSGRDNSVYGCLLKNEILGENIEDVKNQCEDRRALTPVKNLFKYGTPTKKVTKPYSYLAIREHYGSHLLQSESRNFTDALGSSAVLIYFIT